MFSGVISFQFSIDKLQSVTKCYQNLRQITCKVVIVFLPHQTIVHSK